MESKRIKAMPLDTKLWLSSQAIRALPATHRALLLDLMCYMWESSEVGVLVSAGGSPYKVGEIARMAGVRIAYIDKLVSLGLLKIREDGAYFSPDMVRKADLSEKRRKAGERGGAKSKEKAATQKPTATAKVEASLFDDPPVVPQQPPAKPKKKVAEKPKKLLFAEFVTLTQAEYDKLCEEHSKEGADWMVDKLNLYKGSSGKRYKSDYLAIRNWVIDEYYKNGNQRQTNDRANSSGNNQAIPGSAQQADQGNGNGRGAEAQKNYSERF